MFMKNLLLCDLHCNYRNVENEADFWVCKSTPLTISYAYLDNMARGVTSRDCLIIAMVIPGASFSRTAFVACIRNDKRFDS